MSTLIPRQSCLNQLLEFWVILDRLERIHSLKPLLYTFNGMTASGFRCHQGASQMTQGPLPILLNVEDQTGQKHIDYANPWFGLFGSTIESKRECFLLTP